MVVDTAVAELSFFLRLEIKRTQAVVGRRADNKEERNVIELLPGSSTEQLGEWMLQSSTVCAGIALHTHCITPVPCLWIPRKESVSGLGISVFNCIS